MARDPKESSVIASSHALVVAGDRRTPTRTYEFTDNGIEVIVDPDEAEEIRQRELDKAFFDSVVPGVSELCDQLNHEFKVIAHKAMHEGVPEAVAAIRIWHAVLVATRRHDDEVLRTWQNLTFLYMKKHAFDEYLNLPVPPRPSETKNDRHDRHLVMPALAERIAKFLEARDREPFIAQVKPSDEIARCSIITVGLMTIVRTTFPDLKPIDDTSKEMRLSSRILECLEMGRPLVKLEIEHVIVDALEALGVPRATAHNWVRPPKPQGLGQ